MERSANRRTGIHLLVEIADAKDLQHCHDQVENWVDAAAAARKVRHRPRARSDRPGSSSSAMAGRVFDSVRARAASSMTVRRLSIACPAITNTQRDLPMESSEQIKTCAKCGLHIAPGSEVQVTPETVAHARTSYVEHRDCDPKAVVADFHAYRAELRGSDATRIAAIAQEIRPTLDMLKMQALGETLSRKQSKSDSD